MAVIDFIECYYNRRRPHSTIGYKIPAEVMGAFFKRRPPAEPAVRKAA
jgi:putative transposase